MLLKPRKGFPFWGRAVRKPEISKYSVEIRFIEIADIPEHGLISSITGRHIHRMNNLLEVIVNHLGKGSLLYVELDNLVQHRKIVIPIILSDEIIEIHQEFRGSDCSHKLGRNGIYQIDEFPAERFEVGWGHRHAAQFLKACFQERIHSDGDAIRVSRSTALNVLV